MARLARQYLDRVSWRPWALLASALTLLSPWGAGLSRATVSPSVAVVVAAHPLGSPLGQAALGIDAAVTDSLMTSAASVHWWEVARPLVVRFPGGVYADAYDWRTNQWVRGAPRFLHLTYPPANIPWMTLVRQFLRPVDARALVTMNYGSGTPTLAAAWAAQARLAGVAVAG